jgi:hypothetical protein
MLPSAVVRLFVSDESSGPTSSPPPKPIAQSLTWGPGPTSHPPWAPVPGCREVEPPLALVPRLLGAPAKDRESKFSKTNAVVSRHPARGPAKPSSAEVTGQSTTGTGVAVGVTEGGLALIMSASAQKQHVNQALALPAGSFPPLRRARGPLSVPWIRGTPYYSVKARCPRGYL